MPCVPPHPAAAAGVRVPTRVTCVWRVRARTARQECVVCAHVCALWVHVCAVCTCVRCGYIHRDWREVMAYVPSPHGESEGLASWNGLG